MRRRLSELPTESLLHLTSGMAYLLWCLGIILSMTMVAPRILELKGQPPESATVFAIVAVVLGVTFGCVFIHSRLMREVGRRLRRSE